MLHEAARHAIHCFETLSVSAETVRSISQQASNLSTQAMTTSKNTIEASEQIESHMAFQIRMLENLLLRSQSNKERLQNEISLVRSGHPP